jgi:hypothetical protein
MVDRRVRDGFGSALGDAMGRSESETHLTNPHCTGNNAKIDIETL